MGKKEPRKPLRERVADRKAGIRQAGDPKHAKLIRWARLGANMFQGIGLIMLLVLLAQYINSGYEQMNWINVMIYSGMFLIGRAVTSFLNMTKIIR